MLVFVREPLELIGSALQPEADTRLDRGAWRDWSRVISAHARDTLFSALN